MTGEGNMYMPVAPAGYGGNDMFGGNNGWWILILLVLFGWNGNGGFGQNCGMGSEVQRGFDSQNSMANQREILSAVNSGTAQAVAATNQTFHDTLGIIQNRYDELARDISGIAVSQAQTIANQNACCCDTKMLIQQTAADNALQMAQMEARLNEKSAANEIQALRDQVGQLQLAQATNGMLKFPNQWTYGAGFFPPVYGGCCQGNV